MYRENGTNSGWKKLHKPMIIPDKPKPEKSVADICREAAAHKMSYGKYLMYLEGAK